MLAVLTILAVAMTDLIRLTKAHVSARAVQFVQLGWWLAVIFAAAIWVRPEAWVGAVAAIVAAAWYFGAERMDRPKQADDSAPSTSELYAWTAVALVVVIAGFAWLDVVVLQSFVPAGLMWLALALFLTQTSNRITRAVLLLSGRGADEAPAAPGSMPASRLKGGRVIGPLERIFIMVLTVVGAYHVVAALMAAKGIVRFPEISAEAKRDDAPAEVGSKAEEFLVGSLASWGLAGGAGLLAWMFV
ncbi:MAG: hypothetical protein HLX51_02960 [Micrococcaceae bacterium]|nr:hypothetical protein [Micrococcaceae bacterium]